MSKSWLVGGRDTGEAYTAGTTSYFRIGGSVEGDLVGGTRLRFPEAATIRNWAVRIAGNTLSSTCTVTVRINDTTDSALSLVFANTDTNVEKVDTDSVSIAAGSPNDDIVAKVVTAAGGTSITLISHSLEIEPTNSAHTLSNLTTIAASSLGLSAAGTVYVPPFGSRNSTADEDILDGGATWTCIDSFDTAYFFATSGNVTWTGNTTIRTRKNIGDGASSLVFTASDDSVTKYDTSGSDALADGDKFCYSVTLAAGSGIFNLENMGVWLRSASGRFLLATGKRVAAERQNATVTAYYNLGGELDEQNVSEAQAQQVAPFDMTILQMQVYSDREVMTGNSVVTLRKGGAGTGLAVTFDGTTTGYLEDSDTIAVTGGTDALDTEIALGAGTNRDFGFIVYLAEQASSIEEGVGAATGTGAADGVGRSTAAAVGAASGAGAANGTGLNISAAVGAASGSATVNGVNGTISPLSRDVHLPGGGVVFADAGDTDVHVPGGGVIHFTTPGVVEAIGICINSSSVVGEGSSIIELSSTTDIHIPGGGVVHSGSTERDIHIPGGGVTFTTSLLRESFGSAFGNGFAAGAGRSTAAAVGAASGAGAANGVGEQATGSGGSVGAASGAGAANGAGTALYSGTGVSRAPSGPYVSGIGLPGATRPYPTVFGVGVAVIFTAVIGQTLCVSTAFAQGRSFFAAAGNVTATSSVDGFSAANTPAVGSVLCTSEVLGVGAELRGAAGDAAGIGAAEGFITGIHDAVGAAAGTSTVNGVGASTHAAAGSVECLSGVFGLSVDTVTGDGAATGTATVLGVGAPVGTGTGAAAGTSAVAGVSVALFPAVGSAAGSFTVLGSAFLEAIGAAEGAYTVLAESSRVLSGDGFAEGTSSADAVLTAVSAGAGLSEGVFTVTGIGEPAGSATGVFTVTGVGAQTTASVGTATGTWHVDGRSPTDFIDHALVRLRNVRGTNPEIDDIRGRVPTIFNIRGNG